MAAASSKLRSPLWTPSTELSETQQRSWPEAHYLSNAAPLTDHHGRTRRRSASSVVNGTTTCQSCPVSQIQSVEILKKMSPLRQIGATFNISSSVLECGYVRVFPCRNKHRWTRILNTVTGWLPNVLLLHRLHRVWGHRWESQQFSVIPPGFQEVCLHDVHPRSGEHTPGMEIYKYRCI